jgi:O-antigen/teichoic acid export membrane protein
MFAIQTIKVSKILRVGFSSLWKEGRLATMLWTYSSQLVTIVMSIISVKIVTNALPISQYGIWCQLVTSVTLSTGLLAFNMGHGFLRFSSNEPLKDKSSYFWSIVYFQVLLRIAVFLLLIPFSKSLISFLTNQTQFIFLVYILFSGIINVVLAQMKNFMISDSNTLMLGKLNTIAALILPFCSISFVVLIKNVSGPMLGFIFGISICIIMFYFVNKSRLALTKIDWSKIKKILVFSLPLLPYDISYLVLDVGNRYFLKQYYGLESVARYSISYTVPSMIVLVFTLLSSIFFASIVRLYESENFKQIKWWVEVSIGLYTVISVSLVMSLFICSKNVVQFLSGPEYLFPGVEYVFLLIGINSVVFGLYQIFSRLYDLEKWTWRISINWMLSMVVNILLNFILIPKYELIGAAAATLISYSVGFILAIIFKPKRFHISLHYFRYILFVLICFIVAFLCKNCTDHFKFGGILIGGVFCCIFIFFGFLCKIIAFSDINRIFFIKN